MSTPAGTDAIMSSMESAVASFNAVDDMVEVTVQGGGGAVVTVGNVLAQPPLVPMDDFSLLPVGSIYGAQCGWKYDGALKVVAIQQAPADMGTVVALQHPILDADGDGSPANLDCANIYKAVFPGATEACNNMDDDCKGVTDDGDAVGTVQCGSLFFC